jgi:hypothetical protein
MQELREIDFEFSNNPYNNSGEFDDAVLAEWESRRAARVLTPGPVQRFTAGRVDPFQRFAQLEDLLLANQIGPYNQIVLELRQFVRERARLANEYSARTEWDFGADVRLRLRVWFAIKRIEAAPVARRIGLSTRFLLAGARKTLESVPAFSVPAIPQPAA